MRPLKEGLLIPLFNADGNQKNGNRFSRYSTGIQIKHEKKKLGITTDLYVYINVVNVTKTKRLIISNHDYRAVKFVVDSFSEEHVSD